MSTFKLNYTKDCYRLSYNTSILNDKTNKKEIIFGYARISSSKQQNNESIETQIKMLVSSAEYKQQVIAYIYVDEGISGKDLDRPAFSNIIEDMKPYVVIQHNLMYISTCYLHRLTRSVDSMTELCKVLPPLNIGLISLDCPINIKDQSTHFMLSMLTHNNQAMREATIKNTKNILRSLSEEGKLTLRTRYGWIHVAVPVPNSTTTKNIDVPEMREQSNISHIIKLWNESDRKLKPSQIVRLLNDDLNNFFYREDDKLWTFVRVESLLYNQKISERIIPNKNPIELKEKICYDEIINMIKNEKLRFKSPNYICKRLDEKCLYKHKITAVFVKEIMDKIPEAYHKTIRQNLKDYKDSLINEIKTNLLKLSWHEMVDHLNDHDFPTVNGHEWTVANFNNFAWHEGISKKSLKKDNN